MTYNTSKNFEGNSINSSLEVEGVKPLSYSITTLGSDLVIDPFDQTNDIPIFTNVSSVGENIINNGDGTYTLLAGARYRLSSSLKIQGDGGELENTFAFYNLTDGVEIGVRGQFNDYAGDSSSKQGDPFSIIQPIIDTTVSLRSTGSIDNNINYIRDTSYIVIEQVSSLEGVLTNTVSSSNLSYGTVWLGSGGVSSINCPFTNISETSSGLSLNVSGDLVVSLSGKYRIVPHASLYSETLNTNVILKVDDEIVYTFDDDSNSSGRSDGVLVSLTSGSIISMQTESQLEENWSTGFDLASDINACRIIIYPISTQSIISSTISGVDLNTLSISRNTSLEYNNISPSDAIEYDTGYNPSNSVQSTTDVSGVVIFTSSGIKYSVFTAPSALALVNNPDVRIGKTSSFVGVTGSVDLVMWYSSLTETVHIQANLDGGNKTLDSIQLFSSFDEIIQS